MNKTLAITKKVIDETTLALTNHYQTDVANLPVNVKVAFTNLKTQQEQKQIIDKYVETYGEKMPAVMSIIKTNAIFGLCPELDYWILPFKGSPTQIMKSEGATKILNNYTLPEWKPAGAITQGVVYKGEENIFSSITGVKEHIHSDDKRTGKLDDVEYAFAQYKTSNDEVVCIKLPQDQLIKQKQMSSGQVWDKWFETMMFSKVGKALVHKVIKLGGIDTTLPLKELWEKQDHIINNDGEKVDTFDIKITDEEIDNFNKLCNIDLELCKKLLVEEGVEEITSMTTIQLENIKAKMNKESENIVNGND